MLPALGPVFVAPDFYSNLPETGTAALQQALIYERHEALAGQAAQSIAAFASLHVSVVFTAALIAQLLHLHRLLRVALWTFLGADVRRDALLRLALRGRRHRRPRHRRDRGPARGRRHRPPAARDARPLAARRSRTRSRSGASRSSPPSCCCCSSNSGLSTDRRRAVRGSRRSPTCSTAASRAAGSVQSVFGTLVDPFADKLLVLGSLVALAAVDRIPVWIVVIIAVARDLGDAAALLRAPPRRRDRRRPARQGEDGLPGLHAVRRHRVRPHRRSRSTCRSTRWSRITIGSGIEIGLRARRS